MAGDHFWSIVVPGSGSEAEINFLTDEFTGACSLLAASFKHFGKRPIIAERSIGVEGVKSAAAIDYAAEKLTTA
ncbi:hypothetical protein [Halioxenophilus sp. WMMB6]|uniref:hypothetical protein n=1 Tax=Halioxenophilus sp. WMMB6 TaxID=3073815 RepID=UPI00295E42B0|nr:hypothetical protein [Halioxenophilus sp. WMMB6]